MATKMGRPTDNPKPHKFTIRIDDKNNEIIEKYAKQENVSKTEAIRRGIGKLEDDIKK